LTYVNKKDDDLYTLILDINLYFKKVGNIIMFSYFGLFNIKKKEMKIKNTLKIIIIIWLKRNNVFLVLFSKRLSLIILFFMIKINKI